MPESYIKTMVIILYRLVQVLPESDAQELKSSEKIPQHYIASYLGIEPQSLSRIRKNLYL